MSMIRKILLGLMLILVVPNAFSAQTTYGKITLIKTFESQAYIYVEGLNDPFGCGHFCLLLKCQAKKFHLKVAV
ncbi:MAG: hypothetical protein K6L81_06215 [Agarilytica sp.]